MTSTLRLLFGREHPTRQEVTQIADALDREVEKTKRCLDALRQRPDPLAEVVENVQRIRKNGHG